MSIDPDLLLEHIEERLITPRPDCRLWAMACDRGYGRIYIDGTAQRVHRVLWELKHGPIPDDLTIDHLCRVRNCVNTEHMELVTHEENVRREAKFSPRTKLICKRGHQFTEDNVRVRRNGSRACRECERLRELDRRAAREAGTAHHQQEVLL